MESIHSAGFGSSVWKKLQEKELKCSLSSVASMASNQEGSQESESPSDLESYIDNLAVERLNTYTRSNDRRASSVKTIHEGG